MSNFGSSFTGVTFFDLPTPPFVLTARNGLSVDGSGAAVLGNDVGQAGNPAALFGNREIVTESGLGAFSIILNAIVSGINTSLNGSGITVQSFGNSSAPTISIIGGTTDFATLTIAGSTDIFQIVSDGNGLVVFQAQGVTIFQIDTGALCTQFGPTIVATNNATLQVTGTLTNRMFASGKTGAYAVNRDLDSNKILFNSGAATYTLPNMVGANNRQGFLLSVSVRNAGGITIQADAGQVINFGALSSSAGGTLFSTMPGSTCTICLTSGVIWDTLSYTGVWGLT